jgi:hypothetical protein
MIFPALIPTLLWWIRSATLLCAVALLIWTHYLYGISRRAIYAKLTPLSLATPVSTTLAALLAMHFAPLPVALSLMVALIFYLTIKHTPLYALHATCCASLACTTLMLEKTTHAHYQSMLTQQPHSVEGVVTNTTPWKLYPKGLIIDLALTAIDGIPVHTNMRCLSVASVDVSVGMHIRTTRICIEKKKESPLLFAHGLYHKNVGTFFTPKLWFRVITPLHPSYAWTTWMHAKREKLYNQMILGLSPAAAGAFSALFLGNKSHPEYQKIKRLFARWGITHYLARSGLHVNIIIWIWGAALSALGLPIPITMLLLLIFLFVYHLFSWESISFYRALIVWGLWACGIILNKQPHTLYLFFMLTLAAILFFPACTLCLDFQLSFFLTGILLIKTFLNRQAFILSCCIR